jgi:hypothetical protein
LLRQDVPYFNQANPDSLTDFHLPATPIPPKTADVMKIPQVSDRLLLYQLWVAQVPILGHGKA